MNNIIIYNFETYDKKKICELRAKNARVNEATIVNYQISSHSSVASKLVTNYSVRTTQGRIVVYSYVRSRSYDIENHNSQ